MNSSGRGSVWASVRAAPRLLQAASAAYIVTFIAAACCIVLGSAAPGNAVLGAFGLVAAVLGFILAIDVMGSAAAMQRIADSVGAGRLNIAPKPWTARMYRWLGAAFLVGGCALAVVAWSGSIRWRH